MHLPVCKIVIVIPTSQGCGPRFMAGFLGQREMHLAKKPNPYEMESRGKKMSLYRSCNYNFWILRKVTNNVPTEFHGNYNFMVIIKQQNLPLSKCMYFQSKTLHHN